MDTKLYMAIGDCNGQMVKESDYNIVFMYVKNWCPHSQNAAKLAASNCNSVYVVDLETSKFVSPNDLHQPVIVQPGMVHHLIQKRKHLLDIGKTTVPQVFVKSSTGWKYVGGETDYAAFTRLNSSSVADIQLKFEEVKF
jgi:glutaredoxin